MSKAVIKLTQFNWEDSYMPILIGVSQIVYVTPNQMTKPGCDPVKVTTVNLKGYNINVFETLAQIHELINSTQ